MRLADRSLSLPGPFNALYRWGLLVSDRFSPLIQFPLNLGATETPINNTPPKPR
jgi:hypothetical protein